MKDRDIKIELGAVQETLLLPLLARSIESEKDNPILYDTYARDIVARIDYDFSKLEALLTDDIAQQKKDRSILFMAAGVLCYFDPPSVEALFRKFANAYPSAHVVFDSFPWFTTWAWNIGVRR